MLPLRISPLPVASVFRAAVSSGCFTVLSVPISVVWLTLSSVSCSEKATAVESMGEAADSSSTATVPSETQPVGGSGGVKGTNGGGPGSNSAVPAGMGGTGSGGGTSGESEPNGDATVGGASGLSGAGGAGGAESSGGTGSSAGGDAGANGTAGSGGGLGGSADSPVGAGGSGTGGSGTGGSAPSGGGEYGFTYRAPSAEQLDWLCSFQQGEQPGYVYIRLTQTGMMEVGVATVPVYSADQAQLSINGTVEMLSNPLYDYGGGHHNDSLSFDHNGKIYKYYHSSFGFGFRACQLMDCINVYGVGEALPEAEGCGSDRALPEVCVSIDSDGTHAPLVDTFQKCPGDTG